MPDEQDEVQIALDKLSAAVDRFASLPLEFEARGLMGDAPVPAAVFLEALTRVSKLTVLLGTTQLALSRKVVSERTRDDDDVETRLQGLEATVARQGEQIHSLAKTLHQLTVTITGRVGPA